MDSPPPIPNYENPESIGYRLVIVAVLFPVLALCFLVPRLYTASSIIRKWHPDDYLIIVAFLFTVANSIVCVTQTTLGMGNHIWDLPLPKFMSMMKLGMIGGAMTYNLTTLFVKMSILSFYLRFATANHKFRIAVYMVMFFVVGYTIPNAFLFLYICKPMEFYWNWTIEGGSCINQQAAFDSSNILNMATDFMILLMPIWMLWDLRVGIRRKVGVVGILMAGGFVCGVSTMRMVTAWTGANQTDISWHYVTNLIWCIVEMDIGIVCACLPSLRAFFKQFFPNMFVFSAAFEERLTATLTFRRGRELSSQPQRLESRSTEPANQSESGQRGADQRAWWRRKAAAPDVEQADQKQVTDESSVQVVEKATEGSESGKA
ncbi:hypothetical protein QBC40DRAFT_24205 [Triangularia verruculosa]|uniref:Rhodopsin domain-containing protein n=1 Tax=Triangularia verruculosa TaxID=2587418 RepID=A0AAN6XTG8_9PEZI|nr:hypothetical protein QBC40DRAFT_24205 [Triangularia verruculosa]